MLEPIVESYKFPIPIHSQVVDLRVRYLIMVQSRVGVRGSLDQLFWVLKEPQSQYLLDTAMLVPN
jgi:hypothetical protein